MGGRREKKTKIQKTYTEKTREKHEWDDCKKRRYVARDVI